MSRVRGTCRHAARALAAGSLLLFACTSPRLAGSLVSEGGALGSWTLVPSTCSSGSSREFNGADLTDGTRNVRLVDDPAKGYVVTVAPDGDPARPAAIFTPVSCTEFCAEIVGGTTGSLALDCPSDGRGRLHGRVDFADCDSDD